MLTKIAFLEAYKARLVSRYGWAHDAINLNNFVISCIATLDGANTWNHTGPAVTDAYRAIGGKGKATLKVLRALA